VTGAGATADERGHVLAVVVSAAGTVELHRGPAFGGEHADLAADVTAAVRRVLDAYADIDADIDAVTDTATDTDTDTGTAGIGDESAR
jgi:hypothetical protein